MSLQMFKKHVAESVVVEQSNVPNIDHSISKVIGVMDPHERSHKRKRSDTATTTNWRDAIKNDL